MIIDIVSLVRMHWPLRIGVPVLQLLSNAKCEAENFFFLTVTWIIWAYTPDWVLESLSITYYPDR
jgi:hypothetical protein